MAPGILAALRVVRALNGAHLRTLSTISVVRGARSCADLPAWTEGNIHRLCGVSCWNGTRVGRSLEERSARLTPQTSADKVKKQVTRNMPGPVCVRWTGS
jgi:hypothetical protein